jgi:hypothetical protein
MAKKAGPTESPQPEVPGRPRVKYLGKDRIQLEFRIDDLIRELRVDLDKIGRVAACGGCDACKA